MMYLVGSVWAVARLPAGRRDVAAVAVMIIIVSVCVIMRLVDVIVGDCIGF